MERWEKRFSFLLENGLFSVSIEIKEFLPWKREGILQRIARSASGLDAAAVENQ